MYFFTIKIPLRYITSLKVFFKKQIKRYVKKSHLGLVTSE